MYLLAQEGNLPLFPGAKKEFGFTDEQIKRFDEYMRAAEPEDFRDFDAMMDGVKEKVAADPNYVLTEKEDVAIASMAGYIFTETNKAAVVAEFTDEQFQKADGMMLAMTGGLESPFFNDRHMTALDMTDEQKEKFKKINEETKPEREKLIAGISIEVEKMVSTNTLNTKELLAVIAKFRELQKTLKKRRMEVLTEAQIAKAAKLAKAPKFMSVSNLLPKWQPNENSWKPGDPVPGGGAPPRTPGNFPRWAN